LVIEQKLTDKSAEYLKLHKAVGAVGVGVDIVVISREEFDRRSQVPGTVPYWAAKEGKLLHAAQPVAPAFGCSAIQSAGVGRQQVGGA
jgi:hypothetical protein